MRNLHQLNNVIPLWVRDFASVWYPKYKQEYPLFFSVKKQIINYHINKHPSDYTIGGMGSKSDCVGWLNSSGYEPGVFTPEMITIRP